MATARDRNGRFLAKDAQPAEPEQPTTSSESPMKSTDDIIDDTDDTIDDTIDGSTLTITGNMGAFVKVAEHGHHVFVRRGKTIPGRVTRAEHERLEQLGAFGEYRGVTVHEPAHESRDTADCVPAPVVLGRSHAPADEPRVIT
jgi:hypothetical protein